MQWINYPHDPFRSRPVGAKPIKRQRFIKRLYSEISSLSDLQPEGKAPEFDKTLKALDVIEGKKFEQTVRYSGQPKPKVEWFKNDKPISEDSNVQILNKTDDSSTLVINSVVLDDEASYKCVVTNSFGKTVSEAEIVVLTGKCK